MSDRNTFPKANPTGRLPEKDNPSVRYFALKDLPNRPEDDPEVCDARREIMRTGIVPLILDKQAEQDYLQARPRFYTMKYKGLAWSLTALAECGAQVVPQIREQCEYMLENSQERQDGGFAMNTAARTGGGRITEALPCLTGNMV